MRLDIPNMDNIVKANSLPSCNNSIFLDKDGRPLDDGLYSYTIFGRLGSEERRTKFAYVDLGVPFLHPTVYSALIRLDRSIAGIVSGMNWMRVTKGGLLAPAEQGEPGAGTGLDFLYKTWGKWRLHSTGTEAREERLDFVFSFPRSEAFVTKWLIIPAHYRDIDTSSSGAISTDACTGLYARLISAVKSVGGSADLQLTGDLSRARVQEILGDLYAYFTVGITLRDGRLERKGGTGIAGKKGLIHRSLIGKSIDYTARAVISGPDICSDRPDIQQVPYGYAGLPLHVVLTCFFPFIQHELSNFTAQHAGNNIILSDEKKTVKITSDGVLKLVQLYTGTQDKRLLPISLVDKSGKGKFTGLDEALGRAFTLTDLMYWLAEIAVNVGTSAWSGEGSGGGIPKHILLTRYPIEDHRNVTIVRPKVMVTERTMPMVFGKMHFPQYPVLDGERTKWVDSVRPHIGYLPGLGGDFDGDMVSIKGLWTQEANEEAAKMVLKKASLLNASGGPSRTIGLEGITCLYMMTR